MQLFYAPDFTPPTHTLDEQESKHCIRVLRLGTGDTLYITDGRGAMHRCRIVAPDPRRCTVEVEHTDPDYDRLPYRLTMAVAPTKNAERFEWFLEKATEIGVTEIVPIATEHSERRGYKPERGGKILAAAMKQSLKAFRPRLAPLTPFAELLARPAAGRRLIAHCGPARSAAGKRHLAAAIRPGEEVTVAIGPEGDFSAAEIDAALAAGFEEITLGTQRLRTETAAVAATVTVANTNTTN